MTEFLVALTPPCKRGQSGLTEFKVTCGKLFSKHKSLSTVRDPSTAIFASAGGGGHVWWETEMVDSSEQSPKAGGALPAGVPTKVGRPADSLSLCTHKLEIVPKQGKPLGVATGFTMKVMNRIFLITNLHVVTGFNFFDPKKEVWKKPHLLQVQSHGPSDKPTPIDVQLRDDNGVGIWHQMPAGKEADVAIIEITKSGLVEATDLNKVSEDAAAMYPLPPTEKEAGLILAPGTPVSVVGFPAGFSGYNSLPIWKSGHVATDPRYPCKPDGKEHPCYYIDASTREGNSGSPVFIVERHLRAGEYKYRWVGVYSGRLNEKWGPTGIDSRDHSTDVGIVWNAEPILERIYEVAEVRRGRTFTPVDEGPDMEMHNPS